MVLQSSGTPISLTNIQTEFNGTNPISLSEYYNNATTQYVTYNNSIPNSNSIKLSDFYGKKKTVNTNIQISTIGFTLNGPSQTSAARTINLPADYRSTINWTISFNCTRAVKSSTTISIQKIQVVNNLNNNDIRVILSPGGVSMDGISFTSANFTDSLGIISGAVIKFAILFTTVGSNTLNNCIFKLNLNYYSN